jgi:peptidoglycan/xylan/chitin deacetylase (PgdA/CDA1 family)
MSRKAHLAAKVLCPLWRLLPRARGQRVLTYHAIGSKIPGDHLGLHSVTPAQFDEHMAALARLRDKGSLRVGPLNAPQTDVAITFDDGYRDTREIAGPILERHGFPFTIFITVGFARLWMQGDDALYLREADIAELARDANVSIGAHGVSHRRLTTLDDVSLREELRESKAWLEDITKSSVTKMSYPHGSVDARVREAVKNAGFTHAWTSQFAANVTSTNERMLHRIAIWSTDDDRVLLQKIRGDWDWMGLYKRPK